MSKNKYDDMFDRVKSSVEKTSNKLDELDEPLRRLQKSLEERCKSIEENLENDKSASPEIVMEHNEAISFLNAIIDQRKNLVESEVKNNKLYVDTLKILSTVEKQEREKKDDENVKEFDFEFAKKRIKESMIGWNHDQQIL